MTADGYGPCVWDGCPYKAIDAVLSVHLIYEGRSFTKARVPLCGDHLREFGRSKRMNLNPVFLLAPT
jgi:hypothetical protein